VIDAAHLTANLLPTDTAYFDVAHYIRHSPKIYDYDLAQKFAEWCETGVVIFENAVPDAQIDAFITDVECLCRHPEALELEVEYRGVRFRLKDMPVPPLEAAGVKFACLENISLAARRLSLNRLVRDFLSHIFLDRPAVLQSLTFWRGSQQPAHLDYPYVCVQSRIPHLAASWTALEDVHEDAGPLAYYPGSHRQGVIPPFDWGGGSVILTPESTRTVDEFTVYLAEQIDRLSLRPQLFLPKRGDVLIWHGNLLHEGTKVRDAGRTRRSYVTHYTSRMSYAREHYFLNARETEQFAEHKGGYSVDHPAQLTGRGLPSWNAPIAAK
jgi:hypothetical protein